HTVIPASRALLDPHTLRAPPSPYSHHHSFFFNDPPTPDIYSLSLHDALPIYGVLNPTYQAGLRRDAVQPDIEAERKKRDEIEAGKSYCSRRFGGATCDDKSAQIYARFDKNDWRIQPAEFYRFHDAE